MAWIAVTDGRKVRVRIYEEDELTLITVPRAGGFRNAEFESTKSDG